jgi:signal transduction histidine kinase/ActR/RegA family two-component response regulator
MTAESPPERSELVVTHLDGRPQPDVARLHEFLGVLTAYVGGILFEFDSDGRYLTIVTGSVGLLARPVAELAKLTIDEVLGNDVGETFHAAIRRVIDTGHPESLEYTVPALAGRRSFRCEIRPSPWAQAEPERKTAVLLVRDVTEEMQLKAKLVEAERLAAMGLVAASIAHEIRQPLAFATTSADVLARELERLGSPVGGRAAEALEHVRDAIRRIGGIAASVNLVVPDRQHDTRTDIRRPIEAAVDLCASELQGRAKVTLDIPDMPRVMVNEGELCQVIANLLLNAAHAVEARDDGTPSGPEHRRIHVTARLVEGARVRISVSDDGCGISPSVVDRVFDPFFTTKAAGRGTGLGLFVSRRIIEQAGGTLKIEPNVDHGTTVHVILSSTASEPPPSSVQPRRPLKRLRVLVIDDEPSFLRSLELVLEDTHDVVVCLRSVEALATVRANPKRFDAILCDLSMPEIDGVAFYRHMEELKVADRFVLMTAGAFTPRGETFLREAKCRSIGKPFTVDKLLSVLSKAGRDGR